MIHTFRPTDAFVDESLRGQRYLMGCVLLEARSLASVRAEISSLRLGGGRIHFNNESTRQRRRVLAAIAAMPISATVVVCNRGQGTTAFTARSLCLEQIVQHLSVFYRYFDLSNEQAFLAEERRVSPATWEQWSEGIASNMRPMRPPKTSSV